MSKFDYEVAVMVASPPDTTADADDGTVRRGSATTAVVFFGRVFGISLISLGGQAPHVLRDHVGHVCGGPSDTGLTPAHG